jgi:hypothetical protein
MCDDWVAVNLLTSNEPRLPVEALQALPTRAAELPMKLIELGRAG